ncbi:MFS transporter [Paraburkholderia graminis]|uniref:MFS transporter n=1 Tax=Paraburkholderia graminis TaxID=60548 RepID=UPI003C8449AC
MIDGFDNIVIGQAAPVLATLWGAPKSAFGPVFGAGLFGMMVGAFGLGPIADCKGRKAVLIVCTIMFSLFSLATVWVDSINELIALRFVAGLGLGGAVPCAIALTSEFCPRRNRALLVAILTCGTPLGGMLTGIVALFVMPAYGWKGMFILGGVLPLLFLSLMFTWLPDSVKYMALRGDRQGTIALILRKVSPDEDLTNTRFVSQGVSRATRGPVGSLFAGGAWKGTVSLWVTNLCNLLVIYFFTNWLPTLATALHVEGAGVHGSALSSIYLAGITIGSISIGLLMRRHVAGVLVMCSIGLSAIFLLGLGAFVSSPVIAALMVFGVGLGTGGTGAGVNAVAATFYPTEARATGISWVLALGRIGSIIGSLMGGILLAANVGLSAQFQGLVLPMVVGTAVMFGMRHYGEVRMRGKPASQAH